MYNRVLDTFIQVADSKSFAKAAEKLFVSTVSVMKQINGFESSLGIKLFYRTSQGVTLTTAGHSIYQDAKELMRMSERSIQHAKDLAQQEQYTVRIGASQLYPYTMLNSKLSDLSRKQLPFQIKIVPFYDRERNSKSKLDLLEKEFDCFIGIYNHLQWAKDYSVLPLENIPYRLALPRSHRLAEKTQLTLEDLYGEALLLHSQGVFTNFDALREKINKEHPQIRILETAAYSLEAFNICSQKNCLIISLDVWSGIHPSLITLPVDWDFEAQVGLIYSKCPSKLLKDFMTAIAE